ncbi:unnamed protein product [Periconia digitata]|uniref:Uncharacterized protein n=1 Tax=Periconia digitata TaxID=1303443 RepID=A0A9W4UM01_9PLEO|nr:unnamed protein product [Periconia digitata]
MRCIFMAAICKRINHDPRSFRTHSCSPSSCPCSSLLLITHPNNGNSPIRTENCLTYILLLPSVAIHTYPPVCPRHDLSQSKRPRSNTQLQTT